MSRSVIAPLALLAALGCSSPAPAPGSDGGHSGSTSSGSGSTTSGGSATGGTGKSGSGSGSTTSGGSTAGGTGTSGNGGSTGGSGGACALPDNVPCGSSGSVLCCGGSCIDITADAHNCGSCGNACPAGASCAAAPGGAGVCLLADCSGASYGASCQAPGGDGGIGSCCASGCVADHDPQNCGGCGVVCAQGAQCAGNQCSAPCQAGGCPAGLVCTQPGSGLESAQVPAAACLSPSCAGGLDGQPCSLSPNAGGNCCGGSCVDMDTDPNNCNSCGTACATGSICYLGTCEAVAASCGSAPAGSLCQQADGGGGSCCGGCVHLDTLNDPANCGACGQACPSGAACVNGMCSSGCGTGGAVCPPGLACSATTGFCLLDPQACGPSNQMVPCALPTSDDAACCGSACADLLRDDANCGVCGTACPGGSFCDLGQCVPVPSCTAANSGTDCPLSSTRIGKCCSGSCTDVASDPANCFGCGVACPTGEACGPSGCTLPDGGSPGCRVVGCPPGTTCTGSQCLPSSCPAGASGLACAFGAGNDQGRCCGGACVDPNQDPQNCGGCGVACASGICPFGTGFLPSCLPPAASTTGCQVPCQSPAVCVGGQCLLATCGNGPGMPCAAGGGNPGVCCDQGMGGTTCADVASDPANCGGCGIACPSGQSCTQGVCSGSLAPCLAGRIDAYCDLDAGTSLLCCPGGGCTDVETDSQNCGYCGQPCQSGLTCAAGQCLALSCGAATAGQSCVGPDGGTGLCCGTACEAVASDPANCGGCGTTCATGESCVGGHCGFDQCTPSLQGDPCHFVTQFGTQPGLCCGSSCVDPSSDPANCGGCNLACAPDAGCVNSACH